MHRIEAYATVAIIFIVCIGILYLPILFILRKKGVCVVRQIGGLLWFCSIFLIIFATIFFVMPFSFNPEQRILSLTVFNCIGTPLFITEFIPNVMMFIPFGLFTPILFWKMRKFYKTLLIVFFVTLGVETFQYFIGRSADIDDIIANFLGGIIGHLIFTLANHLFRNRTVWKKLTGKHNSTK